MDHEASDVSAHLRREHSKTLPTSLLSQLRALPQIWGSRGRRFESCRPDQIIAGRDGFRRFVRSPFWIFGSQTGSQLAFGLRGGGVPRAGVPGFEDLVHGGCGFGECWADLVAVDRFGDGGAAVAHQGADVLDPDAAVVAEDGHEAVA